MGNGNGRKLPLGAHPFVTAVIRKVLARGDIMPQNQGRLMIVRDSVWALYSEVRVWAYLES